MAKRVALTVGHSEQDGGAVRCTDGVQEYAWNLDLARRISSYNTSDFEVFHRDGRLSYRREIQEVYERTDDWGADLTLELHFNAGGGAGVETFSSGSKGSLAAAELIHPAIVETLGLRDRGIKIRNGRTGGRGHESLIAGRAPALLLEPYFGDCRSDCITADHRKQKLAFAIYSAAMRAV